jgi:hypothetical protein
MAVPGNAYVVQTGGNFTAPAAPADVALSTTAKTVLALTAGTANQPSLVELDAWCDGTSGFLTVEVGLLTAATAGTTTAITPQQIRGWPAQSSQSTAAYNYTVEPTVYSVIARHWKIPLPIGPNVLQFPLGREITGIVTAATAGKMIGIRMVVSTGTPNAGALLEYEE